METEEEVTKTTTISETETTTESRSTANRQPLKTSDQATLQGPARANPCILKDMEERNGIYKHGPFYQDPKCLLTITGRHQERELKVTQRWFSLTALYSVRLSVLCL